MTLSTLADLQAAVVSWNFNRSDLPTADLIRDAEDRLNGDLRLRLMETETSGLATTPASRTVALPASYLAPIALWLELDYGRQELEFVPAAIAKTNAASRPVYWTVDGPNLAFERPADQVYALTFRYLQRFSLSAAAPFNATALYLLTTWPSLYRAAVMIEAALWLQDDPQAVRWQAKYAETLKLVKRREAASMSAAVLRVDPALQRFSRRAYNILTDG